MTKRTKLGLLGKDISYSFSEGYFQNKFKNLKITDLTYRNFDIPMIEEFPFLIYHKEEEFLGFNVTIPYKESILKYLTSINYDAKIIGAVNTIKITSDNELIGYNTDVYGFENSLKPLLKPHHKRAMILGTGGASKAISFVFNKLGIEHVFVSRKAKSKKIISYDDLNKELMQNFNLIVNCSPIGTYPEVDKCPNIPYEFVSDKHFLYDLIYNPTESVFLRLGKEKGAIIKNGHEMLELQAEKSWDIWNSDLK